MKHRSFGEILIFLLLATTFTGLAAQDPYEDKRAARALAEKVLAVDLTKLEAVPMEELEFDPAKVFDRLRTLEFGESTSFTLSMGGRAENEMSLVFAVTRSGYRAMCRVYVVSKEDRWSLVGVAGGTDYFDPGTPQKNGDLETNP